MSDLLPDPGEVFRLWAVSRSALTALVGQRVSIKLAGEQACIRYSVASGVAAYAESNPLLLCECWGTGNALDDGTASLVARTLALEVESFRGEWGGGWVAGAAVENGPVEATDPTTHRPKMNLYVRLALYPSQDLVVL